jgi:CHAT domain-containing protein/tetratricopeptide (TPR) repeat protein
MRTGIVLAVSLIIEAFALPQTAMARGLQPSLQDSFRLGSGGGTLCQAQSKSVDASIAGMFDRAWVLVCRDAAKPVGQLYALRKGGDIADRVAQSRLEPASCGAATEVVIDGLGQTQMSQCSLSGSAIGYSVYRFDAGKVSYIVQGMAAYDSALRLGLKTIVADRIVPGQVTVASTGVADDAGFARLQAAALDPQTTLAEGYRRNNSGNYVEAAQFFDTLQQQAGDIIKPNSQETLEQRQVRRHEYAINRALQLSNLGEFEQADSLFSEASEIPTIDRVQVRLRRNFEAMHMLNQQRLDDAVAILDRPVAPLAEVVQVDGRGVDLGPQIVAEVNSGVSTNQSLGVKQSTKLTPDERAAIIDAQAVQLRGTILRLQGKPGEARGKFQQAMDDAVRIRDGRVTSIARLRAQILAETALSYEDAKDYGSARSFLQAALDLLETTYPETTAVNGARARLAAYLVRRGSNDEALKLYRMVIASTTENNASTTGLANQIKPYFDLLSSEIVKQPALTDDLFLATQTLMRPGAADSMEVLSRELQAGSGEAARLFRQSTNLSRDIERGRIELARLVQLAQQDSAAIPLVTAQQADLKALIDEQATTQTQLAGFSQFRAVSKQTLTLGDLRATLKPGEAYYKLSVAGDSLYAIYADSEYATGYRLGISVADLERKVDGLRNTIAAEVDGKVTTEPFDVMLAHRLYLDLFEPIAGRLASVKHLVFEPDGAMLRLPANLLIADTTGLDAYVARVNDPKADAFDLRGVHWLGRNTAVSTSISARSFRDARQTPVSAAKRQYIGFGNNAPAMSRFLATSQSDLTVGRTDCSWPLAAWSNPIAATELVRAASQIGGEGASVITGARFSDTAISAKEDLNNYRILHFATHGLVTAPRSGCPARPALLTSFGSQGSDGLLSFGEIYDLHLDADLIVLSACDTAGKASRSATREMVLSAHLLARAGATLLPAIGQHPTISMRPRS